MEDKAHRFMLVCGGRTYEDINKIEAILNPIFKRFKQNDDNAELELIVVHGDAAGADRNAARHAKAQGVQTVAVPANWARGKAAGPMRNILMLDLFPIELVVAFPGNRGTRNMVQLAEGRNIKVIEV